MISSTGIPAQRPTPCASAQVSDEVCAEAPASPWLSEELWDTIQGSVPIVCVDLVPVVRDGSGNVVRVGFIRRFTPFQSQMTWCHVGGRVNLGESLAEALARHLEETLGLRVDLGPDPQPGYVMQYFKTPRSDAGLVSGHDPRKHAVALSYLVEVPEGASAVRGGEGLEFKWFEVELLDALKDTWPGSMKMVRRLLQLDAAQR